MKITIKHIRGLDPIKKKEDSQPFIKSLKFRPVNAFPNLYVTVDLVQQPLPDPIISLRTSPGTNNQSDSDLYEWNEAIKVPIDATHFQSPGSELRFVVWDLFGPQEVSPIYYATVPLAGKEGFLAGDQSFHLVEVKDQPRAHHAPETPSAYSPSPMMSLSVIDDGYDNEDDYDDYDDDYDDDGGSSSQGSSARSPVLTVEFSSGAEGDLWASEKPEFTVAGAEDPAERMHKSLCEFGEPLYDTEDVVVPSPEQMEAIRGVMKHLYFEEISEEDKATLHMFGPFLRRDPDALLYFLRTVDWKDPVDCRYAKELMRTWAPPPLACMILLMSKTYLSEYVFEYAVERLEREADVEFLSTYMPQLIWALGITREFRTNSLRDFILRKAWESPALGWLFSVYISKLTGRLVFKSVNDQFVRDTPDDSPELKKIEALKEWLGEVAVKIKATKAGNKSCSDPKEMLREELRGPKLKALIEGRPRLPVDPLYTVVGVDAEGSTVFNSNNRPIKVNFFCTREGDKEKRKVPYPIVFKVGDDMTQDVLILQAMSIMDNILKDNGLDMKMCFYKALALENIALGGSSMKSEPSGIMECVKDSKPVKNIRKEDLKVNDPTFMENLMHSYIGSSVITYVLGIGDRHLDNILVTKEGVYLHIDFGYVFGENPKGKELSSSIRTVKTISDPILVYTKSKKLKKEDFEEEFTKVYTVLRSNANLIIGLFKVMEETSSFSFKCNAVEFLKEKLAVGKTEDDANNQVRMELSNSENNIFDLVYDALHPK